MLLGWWGGGLNSPGGYSVGGSSKVSNENIWHFRKAAIGPICRKEGLSSDKRELKHVFCYPLVLSEASYKTRL